MSTFVLIHGAGDVGWYWHLVAKSLHTRGHDVFTPDLPCDDDRAGLKAYADTVVAAIGDRKDLVVVAQSFGGFTAPLIADRLPVDALVLVAAMVPAPGEAPRDYGRNTGYRRAVREQAARDGVTGREDPYVLFYHDAPRAGATSPALRATTVVDTRGRPMAARSLAGRDHEIRVVYRGSALSGGLPPPDCRQPPGHRAR